MMRNQCPQLWHDPDLTPNIAATENIGCEERASISRRAGVDDISLRLVGSLATVGRNCLTSSVDGGIIVSEVIGDWVFTVIGTKMGR